MNSALLEKVIIGNDLSSLSSIEKVQYVKNVCQTLGLNPVTKPIQLMKFQGKEIPYFTKDASEQLRKINKVSIIKIDKELLDGGLYIVTAYASTPDGRQDSSTGAIVLANLKGDALANAMMKAETKAKRRVTLSICGLGFIDEMEVDSLPQAQKIDVMQPIEIKRQEITEESTDNLMIDFSSYLFEVENCQNFEELKQIFDLIKKRDFHRSPELFKKLIEAKDKKKHELSNDFIEIDEETGEVIQ
ncbi:MAG TPA: hypothetical protein VHZ50_03590 [Puia sp.]|nr:hypothetical protein [Puia sp.]